MTEPLKVLDVCAVIGGFSHAAEHFFQGQFKTTQFARNKVTMHGQNVIN